ncbi:flagellar hook protein FlgE [Parvularcula dongshanensis]|uniref:Flagellar hook protein FlgE n=1 Tax=Parvularcula dongshanensis TaxID=1173995 RepID=A0A840I5M1_9PROT|nr:flagellar hook-basal body complex protein [Parvularcula dongshanensis]MBB4659615.1 flagellar hook protein FlgE [Parvularcula dongshanensis]
MTISSSMNAGIMGLAVNATRLATISDNIANSDTYGYKRAVADFSSMVIQQRDNAYAAGGVRVNAYRQVNEEGSLISTGNSTDLAVAGRGMLPVTTASGAAENAVGRTFMLTPTGSFSPDENGFLRTSTGLFLMGWPTDETGDVGAVTRESSASLEPVNVLVNRYTSTPTERISMGVNLPADATQAGAPGEPYEVPMEYYDNLGRTQILTAVYTPNVPATGSSNAWSVELFDNSTGVPVSLSSFDVDFQDNMTSGGMINAVTNNPTYDAATGEITVDLPRGPVQLFVGRTGQNAGLTQLAADFAPYAIQRDGAAIGDLLKVEVDEQGNLDAIYDTGFRRTLYRIPVGDVPNPNGLSAANNGAFRMSQSSGDVYFWDAGTGPVGETVGYGLMESTVDIASELTGLIETQRAYASNAKIIQTVDEMLQETTNIKR